MLDTNIRNQLQAYLGKLQRPIALIATLDESAAAVELRDLLREVATLSDLISLHEDGSATRRPSFAVTEPGFGLAASGWSSAQSQRGRHRADPPVTGRTAV